MLRVVPMPADANQHGDIFGGWIMSQVDIAGGVVAVAPRARPRRDRRRQFVHVQAAGAGRRPRHVLRGASRASAGRRSRSTSRSTRSAIPSDDDHGQGHRGEPHLCRGRRRPRGPREIAAGCRDPQRAAHRHCTVYQCVSQHSRAGRRREATLHSSARASEPHAERQSTDIDKMAETHR